MSLSEFIRAFAEHNIIIPVLAVGMLISFLFGRRKKKKAGLSSGYEAAYYVFSFLADMTAAFSLYFLLCRNGSTFKRVLIFLCAGSVLCAVFPPIIHKLLRSFRAISDKCDLTDSGLTYSLIFIAVNCFSLFRNAVFLEQNLEWHAPSYVADYSMGFSSRFLSGELLGLFVKDEITQKHIIIFAGIWYLLIIFLASFMIKKLVDNAPSRSKPAVKFLTLVLIFMPGSLDSIWTVSKYGKSELYGLALTLLGVILFGKLKSVPLKYAVMTVCSVVSVMFYQGHIFMFYTMALVVMAADVLQNGSPDKKKFVFAAVSVAVTLAAFSYFQFFAKAVFTNAQEMYDALCARTDVNLSKKAIESEYFGSLSDSYFFVTDIVDLKQRLHHLTSLILLTPLIISLAYIICKQLSEHKVSKADRKINPLVLCLVFSCAIVPQFLLNCDYGRWMTALSLNVVFTILYLVYRREKATESAMKAFSDQIKAKPVLFALLPVYLVLLGKFECTSLLPTEAVVWEIAYYFSTKLGPILTALR